MRMLKLKLNTRLLVVCLLLILLAAPIRPTHAAVTITIWHSWTDAEADQLAIWIKTFNAQQSDFQVEAKYVSFSHMITQLAATPEESRPDIVLGTSDWASDLVQRGFLTPIDGKIDPTLRVTNTANAGAIVGTSLYALPAVSYTHLTLPTIYSV